MSKGIIVFGSILFSLFFLFPSILSAELSNFHYEIIQIAFMNGYVDALEQDLDKIKSLKEDNDKLRRYTKLAVNKYMEKVSVLNTKRLEMNEELKGQSTGHWLNPWY